MNESHTIISIGEYAFQNCSGLRGTLEIPESITAIGRRAFSGCAGIGEVVFGKGVKNLCGGPYYYNSSFYGCAGVKTVTFLGSSVPVVNDSTSATSSDASCITYFFGSSSFKNLATIYTLPEYLENYKSAWKQYVPSAVSFSSDTMSLPVSNLTAEYIYSHSTKLKWSESINDNIVGYYIYRNGDRIGDVVTPGFEDTDLSADTKYIYNVTGHTETGDETVAATLTVTTSIPIITSIYTDNTLNKVGQTDSYIYALVKDSGNLENGIGRFYYLAQDGSKLQIGEDFKIYMKKTATGGVFKANWDITDIEPGQYTIFFEFTDRDGETNSYSDTIVVDNSRPEALSGVVAVGDTNQIVLSWTIAHELDTTKYHIYRRAEDEDEYTLIKKIYGRSTLTYTDTKALKGQKYYYYVVGVNTFGQEGYQSNIAVAIPLTDTEAPRVVQITPVNGSIIGGSVELYAQAQDNIAVIKTELYLSLDKGNSWTLLKTTNDNYCKYTLSSAKYEDAAIYIKGVAYDAAGNVSTGLTYNYKIDNTGPEKVTGLSYESTATTVTLKWQDVSDQDFSFFRVEQEFANGTYKQIQDVYTTLGVNLYNLQSDTEYRYRVVAYDRLGNRGEASDVLTVCTLKDTIAPVITSIKPDANYYNSTIAAKITATDNTGVASIKIQISNNAVLWDDYKTINCTETNKTETASQTIDLDGFDEGYLYIRGIATDIAGNESDDSSSAPYVQYIIDRTAPAVPGNFRANSTTGAIELSWDMGFEDDLDSYTLYRSTDGETYSVIARELYSVNYWDRSVEKGITYYYKLAVCDVAGNVSDMTEAIEGILPDDTTAPEIRSYSPASGSTIGKSNCTFSVMVSDNWKVDKVSVAYTINEESAEKILINQQGINNYYKVLSAEIPVSGLNDGDILHFTISAVDAQGLTATEDDITYTIDKAPPRVNSITVQGDTEKIKIRWTGNAESDLAGYQIYRKTATGSYSMIASRSAVSGTAYEYDDYNAQAKETYYYKVEAVDKYGNAYSKESEEAWLVVNPTVTALLNCDSVLEQGVEYYFDASASSADLGIHDYEFDFGDGTIVQGADSKVIHKYSKSGSYIATLTITDKEGNTAVVTKQITVEEPQLLGTITVNAVDSDGNVLVGMPIYFDLDHTSENMKYTDSKGCVTFSARAGQYAIGAYNDGYLPVKKSVIVRANTETTMELMLVKESIVTGEFEIDRMTLDEIIAAGIDVSNPANQQVVKLKIRLSYGSTPVTMNIVTNGTEIYSGETIIVDTDEGARRLTASVVDLGVSPGSVGNSSKESIIIAIMDVPVEASYLKEFFDVKLHIVNHADEEFELTNNAVTLNVPDGMTLVTTDNTESSMTVKFDSLKGQEEKTINWILRGDVAGEYDLEADYSAVLSQFNAAVMTTFKTDTPITVYGLDAMKLIADINKNVNYGGFYFDLSLQNIGGADIYLPTLDIMENIIYVYKNTEKADINESDVTDSEFTEKSVKLLNTMLKNTSGYSRYLGIDASVNTLSVGETFTKKYVCYNSITSEDFAYLQDAIYEIAEGLGIEVEINWTDADLYSLNNAEEKKENIFSDAQSSSIYYYLMNNENFYYYQQAVDDDTFWSNLGHSFYVSSDCVLRLDWDLFTHESTKDLTRQYIYELLQDESFQSAVDARIDTTYLKTAKDAIAGIKGWLADDNTSVLFDPAELEDLNDVLSETNNVRKLAKVLQTEGEEKFENRLQVLAGSAVTAVGAKAFKTVCESHDISSLVGSSLKSQLGEMSDAIGAVSDVCDAWNKSVEITNQLVAINAAQEEALALTEFILSCETISGTVVYKEVQTIHEGLVNGFKSQQETFCDEIQKKLLGDYFADAVINKAVIGSIDKIFFSSASYGVGTVMTTLKVAFGIADYVFGWEQSANVYTSLRVAGLLSIALQEKTFNLRYETGSESEFLLALKYLIKIRLVGERAYVNLINEFTGVKSDYQGDKVLEAINRDVSENGGEMKYSSLEEYYTAFKQRILSYRDILYGEISTSVQKPDAPNVSINYARETTNETFDSGYEYSLNGVSWITCEGTVIALNPGTVGRHLWVRVKETDDNLSGNITKVYIPARESITGSITAKYKAGVYYIDGLTSNCYYQFSDEKLDIVSRGLSFDPETGKTSQITGNDYYTYFAVVTGAADSRFTSKVLNVMVEKAKTVSIENNDEAGTVNGAGEYFNGEQATVSVTAKQGYEFTGWYSGNSLISNKDKYNFYVYSDIHLEARYKKSTSDESPDREGGTRTDISTGNQSGNTNNTGNTGNTGGQNAGGDTSNQSNSSNSSGTTGKQGAGTNDRKQAKVKVSKIILFGISKKISAGKKIKLTASVFPANAANKKVTWKSSNKKVASVNSSGVVTLKKNSGGKTVTITAIAKDGSGKKATYKITSMKGVVKKITITGKKTVKAGKSLKLKAKVTTSKNANTKLKWSSNNTKYATVSSTGKVKTKKAGKGKKVRITAMATDGSGKKKTLTLKIK